ncbi:MAG: hypothetical protein R3A52_13035 [Polyangiales bacterium]
MKSSRPIAAPLREVERPVVVAPAELRRQAWRALERDVPGVVVLCAEEIPDGVTVRLRGVLGP